MPNVNTSAEQNSAGRTIFVSGMIAADSRQGGATWAVLQYVLGLRQLGHTVYFVEPIPLKSIQPAGDDWRTSNNAQYFRSVVTQFGLQNHAALLLAGTKETVGLRYDELQQAAERADVLFNISGMLTDVELLSRIPQRVYLDLDPAFIQCWHAQGIDMRFAPHTHFVTVGLNIGAANCPVPTGGVPWITTLQPVVLEEWPVATELRYAGLTTVGSWRGYGSVENGGEFYGQKAHSWRKFFTLPKTCPVPCLPALGIHADETADVTALKDNGWQVLDPQNVTSSPDDYRWFIQQSWAELGIAKSGYVLSKSGWFSDRSACYLASGRPVLAQETGFSGHLPTGRGLFAFQSQDDILAAVAELQRDYSVHCRTARELAETHFDSRRVLSRLLREVGVDVSVNGEEASP